MQTQVQGFRLSPQQRRLWPFDAESVPYQAKCSVVLSGDLQTDILKAALQRVVDQQGVLRTSVVQAPAVQFPLQVVDEIGRISWTEIDLSDLVIENQEDAIRNLLQQQNARYDVENSAHVYATLCIQSTKTYVLLITLPAFNADVRTLENLIAELSAVYEANLSGQKSSMEAIQYLQYSEWQNELLEAEETETEREYWRKWRSADPGVLSLAGQCRKESGEFTPSQIELWLNEELQASVRAVARELGTSEELVLLANWQALLWRLSNGQDVVIGKQASGRSYGLDAALGLFEKYLPLRAVVEEGKPFRELLRETSERVAEQEKWQEYFSWSDESGPSYLAVGFEYQEWSEAWQAGGMRWQVNEQYACTERYELKLVCVGQCGHVQKLELHYDSGRYEAAGMRLLVAQYEELLRHVTAEPGAVVEELRLVSAAEREQLILAQAGSVREYPELCVHELFEAQVAEQPEAIAVVSGAEQLSYRELNERANEVAMELLELGVGPEQLVGVMLERSVNLLVGLLGILKAGAGYLPLDPGYPSERLRYMLQDARVRVLLTDGEISEELGVAQVVRVERDWVGVAENPAVEVGLDNLAYVIYTSGSTGQPKGVMIPHRGLVNYLSWAKENYDGAGGSGSAVHSSISFDLTVTSVFVPLLSGRTVRMLSEREGVAGLVAALSAGNDYSLTKLTPTHLQLLSQNLTSAAAAGASRALVIGGEALMGEQLRFWQRHAPQTRLINEYGPTETVVGCSIYEVPAGLELSGGVPIGRAIANMEVYVLDQRQELVPVGVKGELYIGGVGVGRGYLGRAELTAERFVPHPFSAVAGERLYRTGDAGRLRADGELEYLGRLDEQVKLHGYRIELEEIAAVLLRHEAVSEAVVVVREGAPGDQRLVAYVVTRPGAELSDEALREHLKAQLPGYMVPDLYVRLESLPLTANGKVDRRGLPAPEMQRPELKQAYVAPRNETEELLAAIWAEVLGVDRVGVNDDFFALGGDSIRSVRVVALAKERGWSFTVQDLFQHQTIAELAKEIKPADEGFVSLHTEPFSLISDDDRRRLPADVEDAYPLSVLQMGMLYHMTLDDGAPAYHNVNAFHLRFKFDVDHFQEAVRQTVSRHANLRTSFDLKSYSEPLQLVHRKADLPVGVTDLRHLSVDKQFDEAYNYVELESQRLLDLSSRPLIRLHIHRLTDDRCQLTLTEPHSISDGWSTTSMVFEILSRYVALIKNEPVPSLKSPAVTYRDFIALERMVLNSEEQRRYWDEKLRDPNFIKMPRLPLTRRPEGDKRMDKLTISIAPELVEGLRRVARTALVPFKSVVLATHIKVLSTITGQTDLITGLGSNGRLEDVDGDQVRGLHLNTIPFRFNVSPGTWIDFVQQVFANEREMYPYRRYPMGRLQSKFGRQPLFETMFTYLNFHVAEGLLKSGDVDLITGSKEIATTNFALEVNYELIPTTPAQLTLSIGYDLDLFTEDQIKSFLGYYSEAIDLMVSDPSRPHHDQTLVSGVEKQKLLNTSQKDFSVNECIHHLFEQQAEQRPDKTCVAVDDKTLSYAQLNERANQLAHRLRRIGVGPGMRVGIFMERSLDLVVGIVGILKAGAAYVPLDPAYPADRVKFVMEDAVVRVIVTQQTLMTSVVTDSSEVICLDTDWSEISQESVANPEVQVSNDDVAYVIYTSGSTGVPKGVLVTHGNVTRLFAATRHWFDFGPDDIWTLFHSIAFDFSVWEMWGPLLSGGKLVVVPYFISREPEVFLNLLQTEGVTVLNQTPSAFRQLIQVEESLGAKQPALRVVVFGGEALELQSLEPWWSRHGDEQPQLINMYGITETTVHVTYRRLRQDDLRSGSPIGEPIPDLTVYVLDEHQQLAPTGVPGEIYVGGAGLARGYHARADLTAARFIPDPYSKEKGARLYRTGDSARYLPNGELDYLGRIDQQVKIRGFRIELGEIEAVLAQHDAVREVVVVARADDESLDKRLVAYVVSSETVTNSELRVHLQQKLPEYMVPSAFVFLKELPLTASGKVDRRALPAPDAERPAIQQSYVAPSTEVEKELAEIWAHVLGADRVGVHDNFFELGGDSIRSIQVCAKARGKGLDISIQQVFKLQTIHNLAKEISTSKTNQQPSAQTQAFSLISDEDRFKLPDHVEDAYPLTELQLGMLFHSGYDSEITVYHDLSTFHARTALDLHKFQAALAKVVACHPVLRTSFDLTGYSKPLQLVHRNVELPLQVSDLRDLSDEAQEQAVETWFEAEKRNAFSWNEAPLLRFHIHLRSEESFQFSFVIHHSILDGWSVATMLTELFENYFALLEGMDQPVSSPVSTFRDFVALERQALSSEDSKRYWREQLSSRTFTQIPRWHSLPPAGEERKGALYEVNLAPEITEGLNALARIASVPLKTVLLAAHLNVLRILSGQADVMTGLETNGRPEQNEGERVLGLFLNIIPFRQQLGEGTWIDLVRETFANEEAMLAHRRYPMADLQRMHGGQQLFETMFNFVHFHAYQRLPVNESLQILDTKDFAQTNLTFEAKFSLDNMSSQTSPVHLNLAYNSLQLSDRQIEAIGRYYENALASMASEPTANYLSQSLIPNEEWFELLASQQGSRRKYRQQCVHELFEAQVAQRPEAIAVVSGAEQLSYRELNERANEVAMELLELGVGPEQLVGVMLERSVNLLVGLLGILKAGAGYLPLDPGYPSERLRYMLQDARVRVLLTEGEISEELGVAQVVRVEREWVGVAANPAVEVGLDNLAYVIYTSGSTGQPKGVMIPHRGLVNYLSWAKETYDGEGGSGSAVHSSISFDLTVTSVFVPLLSGRTVRMLSEREGVAGLVAALSAGNDYSLTKLTPTHLQLLSQNLTSEAAAGASRALVIGGEALMGEQLRFWQRNAPQTRLINEYGPTETVVGCSIYEVPAGLELSGGVPIGRAIANMEVYVLDQRQELVPVGVKGELYIGGVGVGRGYLGRAELTAERFVPHPFSAVAGERLYRTGDAGRLRADGELEYLGRLDEQVKLYGYRIELEEIAAVLLRHEAVSEAVVVVREGAPGDQRLVGYVVTRPGAELSDEALREHLKAQLPGYMVPDLYVRLESLPLTANGKVDRRGLPAPEMQRPELKQAYVAPRNETEELLAAIWAEVLGVDRVGVNDDFFALGGHSLLATQAVSRIKEVFQLEMGIRSLFEMTTVAKLALVVAPLPARQEYEPIKPIDRVSDFDDADELNEFSESNVEIPFAGLMIHEESVVAQK